MVVVSKLATPQSPLPSLNSFPLSSQSNPQTMTPTLTFLTSLFLIGVLVHDVAAFDHLVGGDFGWNLPPTPTFFSDWARNRTFFLNDKLVIKSRAHEAHDLAQPQSEAEFEKCVQPGFFSDFVGFIVLNQPGVRYFMSTMGNDCNAGMKFAIHVLPKLRT